MKNRRFMSRISIGVGICIGWVLVILPIQGLSQESDINWIGGPRVADLGDNLAQIRISEGYVFANADDTIKLMEYMGNPSSEREIGFIASITEGENWFIVFEYSPVGYIKDDEKDALDADAILESITKGTEEANKIRKERGVPPLHIKGWYEKPHYDERSHNLVWAILGESSGEEVINYDVRLLGRQGYMSATLVTTPSNLSRLKPEVESIITDVSYKKGKSYAEYRQGDKIAKYGLTALIAGGAGAAAVKFGLFKYLAKAWKIVGLAVLAFLGAIWKGLRTITGRRGETSYTE